MMDNFLADHSRELIQLSAEHLMLVGLSILGAIVIGVPLGIAVHQKPQWRTFVMGFVNVFQTIPSLALFAVLIPLPVIGGIGARSALIALVLYSLLPIVANTVAGLSGLLRLFEKLPLPSACPIDKCCGKLNFHSPSAWCLQASGSRR